MAAVQAAPKKDDSGFGKKNPFPAKLVTKEILTSDESSKEVVHYEIDLEGSDFKYEAGDALQVIPVNCPDLADEIIKALDADPAQLVTVGKEEKALRDALINDLEIKLHRKNSLRKSPRTVEMLSLKQLCRERETL